METKVESAVLTFVSIKNQESLSCCLNFVKLS